MVICGTQAVARSQEVLCGLMFSLVSRRRSERIASALPRFSGEDGGVPSFRSDSFWKAEDFSRGVWYHEIR